MQNMVLISGAQFVNGESTSFIVGDNVVKYSSNIEGIIKACCSSATVVNMDGKRDFLGGPASNSNKTSKESDQFVIRGLMIKVIIEITDMIFKGGFNKAIADFYG